MAYVQKGDYSLSYKFHQIIHDTTASTNQQELAKKISWAPGLSLAENSLQF